MPAPRTFTAHWLGRVRYAETHALQQRILDARVRGEIGDTLLLLEHDPVITLGRGAKEDHVLLPKGLLAQRGIEVHETGRGGDVTFHGPGQLVAYPIFDLRGMTSTAGKRKTLGAIGYVRRLEEVLIRSCADFKIPAKRIAGLTGVWTGESTEAKIAALGVHISLAVTSHGIALNVNTNLDYFNLIVPCGIAAKPVTSMEKELGRKLPLEEVAHSVSRNFGAVFQSQMLWLESLDDLIGPSVGVPLQTPGELRKLHGEEDTTWA